MRMLRAVIIDDEENQRENLRMILEQHCGGITVVADANNAISGAAVIAKHDPDVVFLDIQMPGGTGFDLMENLGQIEAKIVLVTAHEDHMRKAFKFNVFDYIVKPVDFNEVRAAVLRLSEGVKPGNTDSKKVALSTSTGVIFLEKQRIVFVKAEGSYTTIQLDDSKKITVSKNLKNIEQLLSDDQFMRVHRSYLINLVHVEEVTRTDGGFVKLGSEYEVPLSPDKKELLFQKMMS